VDPLRAPETPSEPQMVVPNMESKAFDAKARKEIDNAPPTLKVGQP
jgi:hypothetical protein